MRLENLEKNNSAPGKQDLEKQLHTLLEMRGEMEAARLSNDKVLLGHILEAEDEKVSDYTEAYEKLNRDIRITELRLLNLKQAA